MSVAMEYEGTWYKVDRDTMGYLRYDPYLLKNEEAVWWQ